MDFIAAELDSAFKGPMLLSIETWMYEHDID